MSSPLSTVYFILTIFAFLYIAGPILIYFSQKLQATPEYNILSPDQLPPEVAATVTQAWSALEPAGFSLIAYIAVPQMAPNVFAMFAYCAHPVTGDTAMVTSMYNNRDGAYRLTLTYTEFSAHYEDGSGLDTNNSRTLSSLVPNPECPSFRFPHIADPGRLFAIHRALVEKYHPGQAEVAPPPGDPISFLMKNITRSYAYQAKRSILKLDSTAMYYRPTVKGAILMTWGQLWPVTVVRRNFRDQRARKILRELNITPAPVAV